METATGEIRAISNLGEIIKQWYFEKRNCGQESHELVLPLSC
jgi:hypothetical protein